ncbi:unnamed protein product [Arabidopsis arenosa]|uniref:non-specific serine/threonine protein kinase n=1 Tax=Arabidopsis arenosa TaxID=38785 RepID=A0A8S2ADI0_ARAAE|nr:unnamed protein product [Arabidopsis arenosa]
MADNYLTGSIPATISNISTLQKLGMNHNSLTGSIPTFGKVPNLQWLLLDTNSLGSYSFGDLEFLSSLTNCTKLEFLMISRNRLGGDLPIIANLSATLINLGLSANFFSGRIPHDIGNLISLQMLGLGGNMLTGPLPTSLGKLSDLGLLSLYSNRMSGEIPSFIGNFTRLTELDLSNNKFDGVVPPSLGNCRILLHLWIGYNKLNGTIPREIMQISSLVNLSMAGNSLRGSLPKDVGRLQNLVTLNVADNKLSGKLPLDLGTCFSLEELYLQGNYFDGTIPDISGLVAVQRVNLSNNNLFGSIPGYFANFSKLQRLSLSDNNFEGCVPTEGIFQNATIVSVFGNRNLCGGIKQLKLKPCLAQGPPVETKHSSLFMKIAIGESFFNQLSSAGVRGTIGYAAPEYGMGGQPSIHGDLYSFGVLVLEMFTGKRPTNELFEGSFTLHSYTKSALPERVLDIADKSILHNGLRVGFPVVECLKVIFDVGLRCCEESPTNRLATSEAAKELISIRERFFKTRRTARR